MSAYEEFATDEEGRTRPVVACVLILGPVCGGQAPPPDGQPASPADKYRASRRQMAAQSEDAYPPLGCQSAAQGQTTQPSAEAHSVWTDIAAGLAQELGAEAIPVLAKMLSDLLKRHTGRVNKPAAPGA